MIPTLIIIICLFDTTMFLFDIRKSLNISLIFLFY